MIIKKMSVHMIKYRVSYDVVISKGNTPHNFSYMLDQRAVVYSFKFLWFIDFDKN